LSPRRPWLERIAKVLGLAGYLPIFELQRSSFWFLKPREQFRGFLCVRGPPLPPEPGASLRRWSVGHDAPQPLRCGKSWPVVLLGGGSGRWPLICGWCRPKRKAPACWRTGLC